MVYHFLSKWRENAFDGFSLAEEIDHAHQVYKKKVFLFSTIWNGLKRRKIETQAASELFSIYRDTSFFFLYERMLRTLRNISSLHLFPQNEIDSFYDLLYSLSENEKEEQRLALHLLEELLAQKIPEAGKFYALQDLLKKESQFLMLTDEDFLKMENAFLQRKEPGADSGGYISIITAIDKGMIEQRNGKFFIGTKIVQGMSVEGNKIIIKGDHYTLLQNAKWIQGDRFVSPSVKDPYSYFVERGQFKDWSTKEIQKVLGIAHAEAVVSLEIEIFPEQLYIKIVSGTPLRFAISTLEKSQVRRVLKNAQRFAA